MKGRKMKVRMMVRVAAITAALAGAGSALAQSQDQMRLDRAQLPAAVGQVPDNAPVPGNAQVRDNAPSAANDLAATGDKSRAQVAQELAEAAHRGDIVHGDQGLTLREHEPRSYPRAAVAPVLSGMQQ
jgi:hypothetical protein